MAILIHEVWEAEEGLHCCCLAGSLGDGCRETLGKMARLVVTFEASSHFEAMTIYHRLLGREAYTTTEHADFDPYPDEWLQKQQSSRGWNS